ncbi:Mpo1-like protein [Shewanella woodyi]|uniref:Mpo1-like protein n=1 Tax=Shewanella woodyi TaxID=60961 RepID=UPI003748ECC3
MKMSRSSQSSKNREYTTFKAFYPFYLSQHQNTTCRVLHYIGSFLVLVILIETVISQNWIQLALLPLVGYGFAWVGHFVFEKNRPATFQYPLYSLLGDWVMFTQGIAKFFQRKSNT